MVAEQERKAAEFEKLFDLVSCLAGCRVLSAPHMAAALISICGPRIASTWSHLRFPSPFTWALDILGQQASMREPLSEVVCVLHSPQVL